ncbi:MAG: 23S rRNA (uracil(1939)-C(5))-methyltransferase RlmD [Chlamydiia bacterium]|nr:23S rRNA (uracil(1939)-C(5))-methyltransferase RlmD [Chlamydiia bacterium]
MEIQANKESLPAILSKIQKYSKKGHGLAPLPDRQRDAEVVGSVVGDTVLIELGKRKKRTYLTTLLDVVTPSKDRTPPRCKHVGVCGGCTWQQKSYEAQLKEKEKRLASLYPIKPLPIIPCETPWEYRNKMEFSFSQNKEGEKFLGLIIARSKGRVLNLEECHLTRGWFVEVLSAVRKWWEESSLQAYHPYSDRGTLRTLTLREGKMVILTVSGNPDYCIPGNEIVAFKKAVRSVVENPSLFLRIQRAVKGSPTEFYEMHLGGPDQVEEVLHIKERKLTFKISPDSFFQPNPRQAEKLYTRALEMAAPKKGDTVFDLYCGTGTLGIVFAPYVKKVVGIELSPYAVCDGEVNMEENGIKNFTLLKGDVGERLASIEEVPDLVIIDPPRSGLNQTALKHLIRLSPKKILYISCNPATQSENIHHLFQEGYVLKEVQGVDQFPHTVHLETIALLEKR